MPWDPFSLMSITMTERKNIAGSVIATGYATIPLNV